MSYYYKNRRYYYNQPSSRKRTYRRPLYTPAPQLEHTFDIYEYLRKEFLYADDQTLARIILFYRSFYGENASDYLRKAHSSWKNGSIKISQLTMGRIVECMPKFLNHAKKIYILRCEIHNFLEKAKQKLYHQDIKLQKVQTTFEILQKAIINFSDANLHWFIGKNIFQQDQIDYYLHVCKYVLNERLIQAHKQTTNDLNLITNKLISFNGNLESIKYKIDFLNVNLDISDIAENSTVFSSLEVIKFQFNESFHQTFDISREKYILDELMKMNFYEKEGEINSYLKSIEIDNFFSHYLSLKGGKHEVKMTSNFQGEGGVLTMNLKYIPFKKTFETIISSVIKIVLLLFGMSLFAAFIINFKYYWIFAVLLFVFPALFSIIWQELINIKKLMNYGRKK